MDGEVAIQTVRVTNSNDFDIEDRFDGVPYRLEAGKAVTIPLDAAFHIFGWFPGVDPHQVFQHMQKRMGWNTPDPDSKRVNDTPARRFFDRIKIEPVVYRMVEVLPEEEKAPIPRKNKLLAAAEEADARHVG